ncbi:hypothetical protein DTO013E5_1799 [Penicillium roqueforti]|uniref:Genomic scaffold, ProqFM164S03 n=1 Tax=Penicillium roqueforti (strain FM164) TaxID=1365484 RepID=W6QIN6_PENRF|nr:uncharacterized protein LCP9604111_2591 [Penicillium roqueforti]CDM34074.1 unnamed protein product [Penicillium roqueforti FM164]KAF9251190.1 hypothetical protein LCP9604111_2591 [Penicillium roqueforti]KAI2692790.1 hypothetical protein LCP963914a_884 [Penicillium roqueforti]KAI2701901.1 hypothetical protein CBS147332_7677 [Penicillium roqueforti]KAI2705708.1 hypothetical protein CBS147372_2011 [Penicillium roqueforti]
MSSSSVPALESILMTRISMRWASETPFETTDTLVIMVGEWYVDLRVDKRTGKIDWALAGECVQESKDPRRVVFTHEIDSHHNFNVSNPCPFIPLPNGDVLETGTMARPDVPGAVMTDYEEVWRYVPFRKGPDGPGRGLSWILESHEGVLEEGQHQVTKSFLAQIGGSYLVLYQKQIHMVRRTSLGELVVQITGEEVSARREEWTDGQWEIKYALGPASGGLPSMANGLDVAMRGRKSGERVTIRGCDFIVRASGSEAPRKTRQYRL